MTTKLLCGVVTGHLHERTPCFSVAPRANTIVYYACCDRNSVDGLRYHIGSKLFGEVCMCLLILMLTQMCM